MRDEVRKCLRNWRWWVCLPVLLPATYAGRAGDAASIAMQRVHRRLWQWVWP